MPEGGYGSGLPLTLAWWHNALVARGKKNQYGDRPHKWLKALSHSGEMSQFDLGAAAQRPYPCQNRLHQHDQHGHQPAIMLTRKYRHFVIDVDDPSTYDSTQTGRIIGKSSAISARGVGYHVLIHVPDDLMSQWPQQRPIPGADIKSNGFVPLPGCTHYSGEQYEPSDCESVIPDATAELLAAIKTDQEHSSRQSNGNGSGIAGGQQGELLRALRAEVISRSWHECDESDARNWYLTVALEMPALDEDPWDEDGAAAVFDRHWRWIVKVIIPDMMSVSQQAWLEKRHTSTPVSTNGYVSIAKNGDSNGGDGGDGGSGDGGRNDDDSGASSFIPDDYRIPADYDISDLGIFLIHRPARGETWQECIAHRPVIITGLASTALGNETWYELTWSDNESQVRTVIAPVCDITDSRKLPGLFSDLVVTSHTSGKLSKFFGELATENTSWLSSRRKRAATQLGWQGGHSPDFVLGPGRPLAFRDQKNTGSWLYGHRLAGSLEGWHSAVQACCSQAVVMAALAASFAAPLLRLIHQSPFVFDISNGTSTGKTITIGLAASVWGDPAELVRSWNNTLVANEHYLSCLQGMPYFLNESQLAKLESVSSLIYSLTEKHSKGRSRQDGQGLVEPVSYESVLISCGENSLASFSSQGGISPRLVTFEGMPMASAEMASRVKDLTAVNYGYAGQDYMDAVLRQDPGSLKSQYQEISAFLRRSSGQSAVAGRRADSIAIMALAAGLAAKSGLMPEIPVQLWEHLTTGGGAIEAGADDRPAEALDFLVNEVVLNQRSFWRHDAAGSAFQIAPSDGWHGRFEPGEYIAARPDWLKTFLIARGHDYDRTVKSWRERGWIDSRPGALTTHVKIDGRSACIVKITHGEVIGRIETGLDSSQSRW